MGTWSAIDPIEKVQIEAGGGYKTSCTFDVIPVKPVDAHKYLISIKDGQLVYDRTITN